MSIVDEIIVLIFLSYCSYTDIKDRSINTIAVGICLLLTMIERIVFKGNLAFFVVGMIPGICILLISIFTKALIGLGDAFIIIAIGAIDIILAIDVIILSFACAGLYSLIMLMTKRLSRKDKIPFAPFILTGYMGVIIFG